MAYAGDSTGGVRFAEAANLYKRKLGKKVNVYLMVIPTSIEFYCPDAAKSRTKSQRATINNIFAHLSDSVKAVDVYTTLGRHASEDIYLRTDHHWSPLGAYYAAKKFRGENESRIRYLERVLKTAEVISDESKEDEVGMNNYVVVYDLEMQQEETLRIVTSMRNDILNGQISVESPIGKALMGHKVGDVVTIHADDGYSYQMEIRKIIKENDESGDRIRSF